MYVCVCLCVCVCVCVRVHNTCMYACMCVLQYQSRSGNYSKMWALNMIMSTPWHQRLLLPSCLLYCLLLFPSTHLSCPALSHPWQCSAAQSQG